MALVLQGHFFLIALNAFWKRALHIHRVGSTVCTVRSCTVRSLCRILVTATNVAGVIKMGNIVPRAGLEEIPLAFRASVLPLHNRAP